MAVIIQNCKSNLYLHRNGEWTEERENAARFSSSLEARGYVQKRQLADVRLVMTLGSARYDVESPISEDAGETSQGF